jgi:hypothetical protein
VTRLRAALSTETFKLTRELFAKRYGFSLNSIRAIERGKYRLSREMAQRIELATGVSAASLLLNKGPLEAWDGTAFTKETGPPSRPIGDEDIRDAIFLLESALAASGLSSKKAAPDRSREFIIMFQEWLSVAVTDLDCGEAFWDRLFFSWTKFSPGQALIHRFNPNVVALQRTGKQLPRESKKLNDFVSRIRSREKQIDQAKREVLYSMLNKKEAECLRYGEQQFRVPPRLGNIELEEKARRRFARGKGLSDDLILNGAAINEALLDAALNRLNGTPTVSLQYSPQKKRRSPARSA